MTRSDSCIVLHVEDHDGMAFLFKMALRKIGPAVELHRVTNGEDAISFLSRIGPYVNAPIPDLIILDLNLPRRSGFDVLEEMRHLPHLRDVPVFVITSSGMDHDQERALALGATGYFEKPGDIASLDAMTEHICSAI